MIRRPAALYSLLLATSLACGGDATGPVPLGITPAADSVRVGAVLTFDIAGGSAATDSVQGTINGVSVLLASVEPTTLALILPDLAPGTHALEVFLGTDTVRTTITVAAPVAIANPDSVIRAALDGFAALMPARAPTGTDSVSWAALRARLDSTATQARTDLALLSDAEKLKLARVIASLPVPTEPAPAALRAGATGTAALGSDLMLIGAPQGRLIFGDTPCDRAGRKLVGHGVLWIASVSTFVALFVLPADPISKLVGIGLGGVATIGLSALVADQWAVTALECGAQESTEITAEETSSQLILGGVGAGAALQTASAFAPNPAYFFQGRPRTFVPSGRFRPVSRLEIAKDAVVASVANVLDRMHARVARVPAFIRTRLPAIPPRLSLLAPTAGTSRRLAGTGVRIANVKPSTVQLTMNPLDSSVTLVTGATLTNSVNFTYDVISTHDPKIKVTKSGTARPFMSAAFVGIPATIEGTRTTRNDGINTYGKLTCGGSAFVRVKGGDKGEWGDYGWRMTGPETIEDEEPIDNGSGGKVQFAEGDHPISDSWWYEWSENQGPVFKPFTITLRVTYTDLVTGELKNATTSFNCV